MPLYKRKPFTLLEPPQDLDPHELVFQVRFTKEIFRDYQAYLKKVNLYRRRVWTCKITGKTNLTYEEALVSEHRAAEKVQQFPKELMAPILRMVQYSTLSLNNLVNEIYSKLQEDIFEGLELHGKKEHSVSACKILKILDDGETNKYEVGWIGRDKKITDRSLVKAEDLTRKKPLVSKNALKAFIRESTFQNAPWVVHEKLAKNNRINTEPPAKLMDEFLIGDGYFHSTKLTRRLTRDSDKSSKRRKEIEEDLEGVNDIRKKLKKDEEKTKQEPMKYPIDDLLVQPAADDPIFTKRPSLSTDFKVPMDCVGDLLMVWDFCSSFSRLMHLWPFSLTDFENAVCHKESNLVLIMEVHSAILHLLNKDGEYFMAMQKKRRKSKITLVNWVEYVCDFLEMEDRAEFSGHLATVRRGHYGLLDTRIKLGILRELVAEALTTGAIRDKLDDRVEQQQALAATTRELARRTREEQDLNKEEPGKKEMNQSSENGKGSLFKSGADKGNHISENGDGKHDISKLKDTSRKLRLVAGSYAEKEKEKSSSRRKNSMRGHHRGKDKHKEVEEKKSEGQKQQFEREIEKLSIRTSSLGKDRDYNRYWFFRREGRLFVESSDSKQWGYYTTAEELNALLSSLNPKGERERALKRQLEKFYNRISAALHKRSKDIAQRDLLEEAVLRRSTRVRAQPRDNPAMAFLKYVNKWTEN